MFSSFNSYGIKIPQCIHHSKPAQTIENSITENKKLVNSIQ